MVKNSEIKMAVVSGASHAVKFFRKNPRASDSEIIKNVVDNLREIVAQINKEE